MGTFPVSPAPILLADYGPHGHVGGGGDGNSDGPFHAGHLGERPHLAIGTQRPRNNHGGRAGGDGQTQWYFGESGHQGHADHTAANAQEPRGHARQSADGGYRGEANLVGGFLATGLVGLGRRRRRD